MVDKLDAAVPNWSVFTRRFQKIVDISMTPQWHKKVWTDGGHFHRRGDFRELTNGDFPVILHQSNKHDHRQDDKIELIETGTMSMLDITSTLSDVYDRDALELRILRTDLAVDVPDIGVGWFRDNVDVLMKQTMREWQQVSLSNRRSEQISAGRKPNQIRVYDKTGHRAFLLAGERRKLHRDDRPFAPTFEQRWGYAPEKQFTRVERQVAAGDVWKVGIRKVGHIFKAGTIDPFTQLVFPDDLKRKGDAYEGRGDPYHIVMAEWIREAVLHEGITLAKNRLFRMCRSPRQFYRFWQRYREFAQPTVGAKITRPQLLQLYRESIDHQLAA